ncbi:MAG: hypothetical protein G01um1014106_537 [Parcubacteria group bacterium Gr01-1014_106]|nr:MAG: hypothetical protein G01um1014106_537 [Parcubacteria group bacterium Gr01-1014_106]
MRIRPVLKVSVICLVVTAVVVGGVLFFLQSKGRLNLDPVRPPAAPSTATERNLIKKEEAQKQNGRIAQEVHDLTRKELEMRIMTPEEVHKLAEETIEVYRKKLRGKQEGSPGSSS